jgi:hypothetical protein
MSIRGKGYDAATGVEDDSSVKFHSGSAGQSSHAAEIAVPDGGGRVDLDPDDPAFAVLQNEIDLPPVGCTERWLKFNQSVVELQDEKGGVGNDE